MRNYTCAPASEDTPADLGSNDIFRKATTQDTVSEFLMKAVTGGWPESRKACHSLLIGYWNYTDENGAENGLLNAMV